jgi:hypothetical protein
MFSPMRRSSLYFAECLFDMVVRRLYLLTRAGASTFKGAISTAADASPVISFNAARRTARR